MNLADARQLELDALIDRLRNWGRDADTACPDLGPQPPSLWSLGSRSELDWQESTPEPPPDPVDELDAQVLDRHIRVLTEIHRATLTWHYVHYCHAPRAIRMRRHDDHMEHLERAHQALLIQMGIDTGCT